MEALRELAPRLNKTADSASSIIKSVEKFLNELGIGISGYGSYFNEDREATDDGPRKIYSHLAYGRMHGDFCIHVLNRTFREEPDSHGVPQEIFEFEDRIAWSSCTREIKLQSFATLPKLLADIVAKARKQAEAADQTAATLRETMGTLAHPIGVAPVVDDKPSSVVPASSGPIPSARRRR
jgi:hypothetical protein